MKRFLFATLLLLPGTSSSPADAEPESKADSSFEWGMTLHGALGTLGSKPETLVRAADEPSSAVSYSIGPFMSYEIGYRSYISLNPVYTFTEYDRFLGVARNISFYAHSIRLFLGLEIGLGGSGRQWDLEYTLLLQPVIQWQLAGQMVSNHAIASSTNQLTLVSSDLTTPGIGGLLGLGIKWKDKVLGGAQVETTWGILIIKDLFGGSLAQLDFGVRCRYAI